MYKKGTSSFFSSYDPGQGGGNINDTWTLYNLPFSPFRTWTLYDESNISMSRITRTVDGGACAGYLHKKEILSFITYDDPCPGGGNISASNHYILGFSPFVDGGAGYLYVNHILLIN